MSGGAWPNVPWWSALEDGRELEQNLFGSRPTVRLSVIDCGKLLLPHGRLVVCDPFAALEQENNRHIQVEPGSYRVKVTVVDVSGQGDGSHEREAYATILLSSQPEVDRRVLEPLRAGETSSQEALGPDEFFGFGVDAGTACFVDDASVRTGMPAPDDWYEELFENDRPESWFSRMDDPDHIHPGLANLPLPLAQDGANIILVHSGWGDGFYPVIGGFDAEKRLVRIHIDFGVIHDPQKAEDQGL